MKQTLMEKKKNICFIVPYQGKKVDYVVKSMKKRMKSLRPTGTVTKLAYVGNKLISCFRVKDVTEF